MRHVLLSIHFPNLLPCCQVCHKREGAEKTAVFPFASIFLRLETRPLHEKHLAGPLAKDRGIASIIPIAVFMGQGGAA